MPDHVPICSCGHPAHYCDYPDCDAAQGMSAGTAETLQAAQVGTTASPVREADAPNTPGKDQR